MRSLRYWIGPSVIALQVLAFSPSALAKPTIEGSVTYSPFARISSGPVGGGGVRTTESQLGVRGEWFWYESEQLDVGLGLSYTRAYQGEIPVHFASAPVSARLKKSLGGPSLISVRTSLGLTTTWSDVTNGYGISQDGNGFTAELGVAYEHSLGNGRSITSCIGVSFMLTNPSFPPRHHGGVSAYQAPFYRLGLRF